MERDPNLITSDLCRTEHRDGVAIQIDIYRLEHETGWALELVDPDNTSIAWDDLFETDDAALAEALSVLDKEGSAIFQEPTNIIPFNR